jgi:hypothetical protein
VFPSGLDPRVANDSYAAILLWFLGYPERALHRGQEGIRLAQKLSSPVNRCEVHFFTGLLRLFRWEGAAALEDAETVISLSTKYSLLFFEGLGRVLHGGALSACGRESEGITQIRHGLEIHRRTGARVGLPAFLAILADAYSRNGQISEGLQTLADALALIEDTGELRSWGGKEQKTRLRLTPHHQENRKDFVTGGVLHVARPLAPRTRSVRAD